MELLEAQRDAPLLHLRQLEVSRLERKSFGNRKKKQGRDYSQGPGVTDKGKWL